MTEEYMFKQLIDVDQVRRLLESHHHLSGMAYALFDNNENDIVSVGWQDICTRFHRVHPVCSERCRESDAYVKSRLHEVGEYYLEYRCGNGLIDVAMPIIIEGRHLATFFMGQFLYDDDPSEREDFLNQAREFGFDPDDYLAALEKVPVYNHEQIRANVTFLHSMVQVLAESGLKSLRLANEMEQRRLFEERYAILCFALDHVCEAAYLIDGTRRFLYVNQEACRSLGYSRDELIGMTVPEIDPDYFSEMVLHSVERIREEGSHTFETRHRTKDGRIFPVEITSTLLEYEGERYSLALVRDISERKQMEEQLRFSEQQFRTLAENSPGMIIRYDLDCRRVYVNPSYTRVTGIAVETALGVSPADPWLVGANVTPEEYARLLRYVMGTGDPAEILLEWPDSNTGRLSSHLFHIVAERGSDGNVNGCLAIDYDITRLRETELKLAKLARALPGVIYSFLMTPDCGTRMAYVSPRIEELFALSSEVTLKDMSSFFARIHPDDLPRVMQSLAVSARELSTWTAEFRVLHPIRGEIWVESNSIPELQCDDNILWYGYLHDITERKRNEEALNIKRMQLAVLSAELSLAEERERQNIAAMLHDHIGQTLLLISIKLGILANEITRESDTKIVEEARTLLDGVTHDIHNLTVQMNPPILAAVGLEAALEWLGRRMEEDYGLFVEFEDDMREKPLLDEVRSVVYQCGRELLINVAKHANTDHARIVVAREDDRYRLTIEDDGDGFDTSRIALDTFNNCRFGLISIQIRIERLGGSVVFESLPGEGSRMTILAPLAPDESMR